MTQRKSYPWQRAQLDQLDDADMVVLRSVLGERHAKWREEISYLSGHPDSAAPRYKSDLARKMRALETTMARLGIRVITTTN